MEAIRLIKLTTKLEQPNSEKMQKTLVEILLIFGLIDLDLQG